MTDIETTENVFEALDLPYHAKAVEIVEQIEFLDTENKRKAVSAIASALEAERLEERREIMNLLGYDENGKGLTTKSEWNVTSGEDEAVTDISICHDPYYDLEGALIDLRRQGADKVCIHTIERIQEKLANVAKRAAAIRNRST